jgi:antitoxin CcdA
MAMPIGNDSAAPFRRLTNLSLDSRLVDEAEALGLNVSRACERGLATQIAEEKGTRWRADHAEALRSSNAFVAENGLPLAAMRPFG